MNLFYVGLETAALFVMSLKQVAAEFSEFGELAFF
jgi:hypothetical protein